MRRQSPDCVRIPSGRLKICVLKADGKVVAEASMYLASNGIAYLGTAATRKDTQGLGLHGALIGCYLIAATALTSSQSRRNQQRAGLTTSHAQALYRLADN